MKRINLEPLLLYILSCIFIVLISYSLGYLNRLEEYKESQKGKIKELLKEYKQNGCGDEIEMDLLIKKL